ncbi:MAG TPA: UV damage endonuclease UvsE, partial [Salinarimonas sp.]|nr:UV damage endonuclease UvsE [Salinarimonas sp.]
MTHDESRLGFCCKFIPVDGDAAEAKRMNITIVTMAYLGRLGPAAAYDKLAAVVAHNLEAVRRQVDWVAGRPPGERLLRLSSQILPGYTHPTARDLYRDGDLRGLVEGSLAETGALARAAGIRISMHPGQFCVLSTLSESALANAIDEVEYHAEIMGMLGYGGGWHPHGAHVNIHGGARAPGVEGFRAGLGRVSRAARDLLTVENDETSYGLDDLLGLADALPIVLDVHHHWIASRGEYIEPDDPRIARVRESWRGVRPLSHISVSREDLLVDHDPATRPDFAALMEAGITAKDLRAHSDMMWNHAVNDLVGRHLAWSDFEIEAKFKNLASEGIAAHIAGRGQGDVPLVLPV